MIDNSYPCFWGLIHFSAIFTTFSQENNRQIPNNSQKTSTPQPCRNFPLLRRHPEKHHKTITMEKWSDIHDHLHNHLGFKMCRGLRCLFVQVGSQLHHRPWHAYDAFGDDPAASAQHRGGASALRPGDRPARPLSAAEHGSAAADGWAFAEWGECARRTWGDTRTWRNDEDTLRRYGVFCKMLLGNF